MPETLPGREQGGLVDKQQQGKLARIIRNEESSLRMNDQEQDQVSLTKKRTSTTRTSKAVLHQCQGSDINHVFPF